MLMQYFADDHVCICYTATMFLEFWKRRQAEIAYEWDLLGYEDEDLGSKGVNSRSSEDGFIPWSNN